MNPKSKEAAVTAGKVLALTFTAFAGLGLIAAVHHHDGMEAKKPAMTDEDYAIAHDQALHTSPSTSFFLTP